MIMNTPIIRIEMEGLKAGVMHHMEAHNEEFNQLVQQTLEQTLSEDWIKAEVQKAVNRTVRAAIDNLGSNWHLQNAVDEALGKALAEIVKDA